MSLTKKKIGAIHRQMLAVSSWKSHPGIMVMMMIITITLENQSHSLERENELSMSEATTWSPTPWTTRTTTELEPFHPRLCHLKSAGNKGRQNQLMLNHPEKTGNHICLGQRETIKDFVMKTVGARRQDTCFLISTVTKHLSIQAAGSPLPSKFDFPDLSLWFLLWLASCRLLPSCCDSPPWASAPAW